MMVKKCTKMQNARAEPLLLKIPIFLHFRYRKLFYDRESPSKGIVSKQSLGHVGSPKGRFQFAGWVQPRFRSRSSAPKKENARGTFRTSSLIRF